MTKATHNSPKQKEAAERALHPGVTGADKLQLLTCSSQSSLMWETPQTSRGGKLSFCGQEVTFKADVSARDPFHLNISAVK